MIYELLFCLWFKKMLRQVFPLLTAEQTVHMWQSHSLIIINRFANKPLQSQEQLCRASPLTVEAGLLVSYLKVQSRTVCLLGPQVYKSRFEVPPCVSSSPQAEAQPKAKLKRSSSVQEIFSSPRNKLLRQSSLQQQKVLATQVNAAKPKSKLSISCWPYQVTTKSTC